MCDGFLATISLFSEEDLGWVRRVNSQSAQLDWHADS